MRPVHDLLHTVSGRVPRVRLHEDDAVGQHLVVLGLRKTHINEMLCIDGSEIFIAFSKKWTGVHHVH